MSTTKSPVKICDKHTGKMEGLRSISTSCLDNPFCQRNRTIEGAICKKCYADTMMKMYKDLRSKCLENFKLLAYKILDDSEIPIIEDKIFRFESFGDVYNYIQLYNYVNIARKNPDCRFTLWSKNYPLIYQFFRDFECPENFTMIMSSLKINERYNLDALKSTGHFKPGQLKVFTVFSLDYIKDHRDTVNINCGSRSCFTCRCCYEKNSVEEVNEILKNEQSAAEEYLSRTEEGFGDKCLEVAEELEEVI